jgi:hypothetical protein
VKYWIEELMSVVFEEFVAYTVMLFRPSIAMTVVFPWVLSLKRLTLAAPFNEYVVFAEPPVVELRTIEVELKVVF